jgi:hypothetical protein
MYDVVQNPIPHSDLFVTPTLEEVNKFIAGLPEKERANASLVFMFTLNACHKMVQNDILSKEVFAG